MHVAITGASSGIGAALARAYAKAGADLTLVARRRELLEQLAREIGTRTHLVTKDLNDPAAAADWIAESEAALGPIDVLINNAGVQILGPTAQMSPERGEDLLRLNLFVPLRLAQRVLPGMLARGRGTIVNVASMAALAPTPGMTHYNAAKGGLAAASEALRGELRTSGVNVLTVYPGIIDDTDMARSALATYESNAALDMVPRGSSKALADVVLRAVERRRARVIYPYSGVWARWFPGATRWLLDRFSPPLGASAPLAS